MPITRSWAIRAIFVGTALSGLLGGNASGQVGSSQVGNAARVQPTAAPSVDPLTRAPLPVKPWEKVVPFADGKCASVLGATDSTRVLAFSWRGNCRFGLANGKGYNVDSKGKFFANRYSYGLRATNTRQPDPNREANYFDDRSYAPIFRSVNFVHGLKFEPQRFRSVDEAVHLSRFTTTQLESFFFGVRKFDCPFKAFTDAPDVTPTSEHRSAANRICSLDPDGKGGGLHIWVEYRMMDMSGGQWTLRGPPTHQIAICRKDRVADASDCSEMIQTAIAPYLDEINGVIAADKDSYERANAEMAARFAPLEQQRRALWAALFAPYRRPSAAVLPPTPVRRKPVAAPARKGGRS